MPAAVRIDIHMGSFGGLAVERADSMSAYLDALTAKLAEAVRACILENTNDIQDEVEGSLTRADAVRTLTKHGLGDPWPPAPESSEPKLIGEGIDEHFAKLASGQWNKSLMRENAYDDGSRYIYVTCDFG